MLLKIKLLRYVVVIFLFLFNLQYSVAQKSNSAEIKSLRQQIDTSKTLDFDNSLEISRKGYQLSRKLKSSSDIAFFAAALGKVFHMKAEMDSALHYHLIAFHLFEKEKNVKQQGLVLTEIAKVHRKLKNKEKALMYYEMLLNLQTKAGNHEGVAIALNESGVVYEQMGNYSAAQNRYRKSLKIQQERKDSVGIAYALEFIGYNYFLQSNWKESEQYLLESLTFFEAINDSFGMCHNYSYLGQLYSKMKQFDKSAHYVDKSMQIARKIKYPDIQIENLGALLANAEMQGDFQNGLQLQKQIMHLKDSLYNIEKIKNVENINEKYQTEKKEKQILIQQNEIQRSEMNVQSRNHWIIGLSILTFLVAIIGFLIYKDQRMRIQQQQKESALKLAVQRVEAENLLQEQRLNISRDLHDNIGSQLTFVISSVDTLKHFMGNKDSKVSDRLTNVSDFVKDTIVELRDTIWAMNHSRIDIEDLNIRISNLIANATRSVPNIHFSFVDDVPENLKPAYDSKTGMNIYRIIQEAVNNAVKHAQATKILVAVSASEENIIFEISDNGTGFKVEQQSLGNGLLSMQKRADEVGINFQLSSSEQGTSLKFSVNQQLNTKTT